MAGLGFPGNHSFGPFVDFMIMSTGSPWETVWSKQGSFSDKGSTVVVRGPEAVEQEVAAGKRFSVRGGAGDPPPV